MTSNEIVYTDEQLAIREEFTTTKANLSIAALAGTGKTAVNEMIAKTGAVGVALAFNKSAQGELEKRLRGTQVVAKTVNALGNGAVRSFVTVKGLDKDKVDLLARAHGYEYDSVKLMRHARLAGMLPELANTPLQILKGKGLVPNTPDQWGHYADLLEVDPACIVEAKDLLYESLLTAVRGTIDFDDQVYIPALFATRLPPTPLLLCDEVQDFSPLNHAFVLRYAAAGTRIVMVGDENQSIYAFRGAMTNSMAHLTAKINATTLPLTTCFRCSKAVVAEARKIVPALRPWENAADGKVNSLAQWNAGVLPQDSVVLCRNNAPLFGLAYQLLTAGIGFKFLGQDVGKALAKTLKEVTSGDHMPIAHVKQHILNWRDSKVSAAKVAEEHAKVSRIEDRAECLLAIVSVMDPTSDSTLLNQRIAEMSHSRGDLTLSSIHQFKGLQRPHVFFLDSHLIPSKHAKSLEDFQQETNLSYVATTRAQQNLTYVTTAGFIPPV